MPRPSGLGAIVSLVCHSAVAGLILFDTNSQDEERDERLTEFVHFLVPPDKNLGGHTAAEGSMEWQEVGRGTSEGPGEQPGVTEGTVPTGDETVPEAGGIKEPEGASLQELLTALVGDSVLTQLDVDSSVARFPDSASPAYPPNLLAENIEGSAFVLYVVDTNGLVDTTSLKVVRTTHPGFVEAVREALPGMRFRPAMLNGRKVRQLVQQSFAFRITLPTEAKPKPKPPTSSTHD